MFSLASEVGIDGKESKQSKIELRKDLAVSSTNLSSRNDGSGDWGSIVLSSKVG